MVHWRDIKDCPPSSLMIASPYDLDSRYSEKRGHHWRGYKVHLTETCDDEAPHLITHVETTFATDQDVTVVDTIHQGLAAQALLPTIHVVDGAYVSSDALVASQQDYQVALTGPMRQDQGWQAHDEHAFDTSHFVIDWDQEVVTCPNGKQSRYWKPAIWPARQTDHSGAVSQTGLHGMCGAAPMYTERHRTARADLTPQSPTDGAASGTGTPADRTFQRALQTSGRDRRNHIAGGLCLGDAADAISGDQEDPSAPHRDRHGHQSATLYRLVVGGATLENVHITFRPISTSGLIRQQHLSRTYSYDGRPPPRTDPRRRVEEAYLEFYTFMCRTGSWRAHAYEPDVSQ